MGCLIVGGAGFLGSHLVDRLLVDGEVVDVVDDLSTGSLANLAEARSAGGELKFHHLDVAAPELTALIGMRRPSTVYHLAAAPRISSEPAAVAAALAGTLNLLEAARIHSVAKVVVALPAISIFGRPAARDLPLKERPLEPRGVDGVVARAIVDLLDVYRTDHAIEYTALALASVYGPRQRPDGGTVARFLAAHEAGTTPTVRGDGRQTRDHVFVDDTVDALARAGRRGSGLVINIGTGVQTAHRELWELIAGPGAPALGQAPAGPDLLARFAVSPVRARIHLGWSPWTPLAEGIAITR